MHASPPGPCSAGVCRAFLQYPCHRSHHDVLVAGSHVAPPPLPRELLSHLHGHLLPVHSRPHEQGRAGRVFVASLNSGHKRRDWLRRRRWCGTLRPLASAGACLGKGMGAAGVVTASSPFVVPERQVPSRQACLCAPVPGCECCQPRNRLFVRSPGASSTCSARSVIHSGLKSFSPGTRSQTHRARLMARYLPAVRTPSIPPPRAPPQPRTLPHRGALRGCAGRAGATPTLGHLVLTSGRGSHSSPLAGQRSS